MSGALISTGLWLLAIGAACVPFVVGIWWLDERRWRRERNERMYDGRTGRPQVERDETTDVSDDEFRAIFDRAYPRQDGAA